MIIAVDTGGTKTLVALFSMNGEMLKSQKFPTQADQKAYLADVTSSIQQVSGDHKIDAISLALPGVIKDQKAVICRNLGWYDFDVIGALRATWPDTPMFLENDANLGGLGVANLLPDRPQSCLYLTISTGIGGGYIVNQAIDPGLSTSEFGDITFEYRLQLTSWEKIAGGKALYTLDDSPFNDSTDSAVIDEVARRISRGLMTILPILRPEVIAIGGGLGARYDLFSQQVEKELAALPNQYHCPIITAPYPEEIVTYGCYFYAINQLSI
ncbi:hypothetical protein B7Y94_04320 [Candidatus Saccharibacteria bacterium 32-49-12]|nr:MAG: hypothetical protein B7Y94_04320 [Candidatus Saccharibacteria bacterium 32-49-12]